MTPEGLAREIIDAYVAHYRKVRGSVVTRSAVRLDGVTTLTEAVTTLADILAASLDHRERSTTSLMPAMREAQRFRDDQFVDLADLAQLLATSGGSEELHRAGAAVAAELDSASPRKAVTASQAVGRGVERAHGLSIYLPLLGTVSPAYHALDFARDCTWASFLDAFAAA
jgi:hypothetical protein